MPTSLHCAVICAWALCELLFDTLLTRLSQESGRLLPPQARGTAAIDAETTVALPMFVSLERELI